MHMASPEACFQAPTAEEAIEQIHHWMPASSSFYGLSLRDGIETLCLDPLTPNELDSVARLGPLNLFAIVSGEDPNPQSFTLEPSPNTLHSVPLHDIPTSEPLWGRGTAGPHPQRPPQLESCLGDVCRPSVVGPATRPRRQPSCRSREHVEEGWVCPPLSRILASRVSSHGPHLGGEPRARSGKIVG